MGGGARDSDRANGICDDKWTCSAGRPIYLAQLGWRTKNGVVHERKELHATNTANRRHDKKGQITRKNGHSRRIHERVAKSESGDEVGACDRCRMTEHLQQGDNFQSEN